MTQTTTGSSRSHFVEAGNTLVHAITTGDSPETIVLIHGGGPGASSWSNFSQNVPALSEQFSLVLLDLPGYGKSGPAADDGDSAFDYYAGIVEDVLDHLGVERAHFIGNSLGGGVSFRFAATRPERTGKLVLLGPAGVNFPVFTPSGKIHTYLGKVSGALLREPGPDTMRAFIENMVYDRSLAGDEVVEERLVDLAAATGAPDPASPMYKMWLDAKDREVRFNPADFESWRDCHKISAPTLLLWGRDDIFVPVDGALYPLQYMPNAELQTFGKCGHWVQVEQQCEFDQATLEFLTRPASTTQN
ncbi:alpha/beta fold hydrolase [Rhodococcus opacus]|nr:alpha/beta fold hydrolase [Rhodococcus opacus]